MKTLQRLKEDVKFLEIIKEKLLVYQILFESYLVQLIARNNLFEI
jgi:hypothetical protein